MKLFDEPSRMHTRWPIKFFMLFYHFSIWTFLVVSISFELKIAIDLLLVQPFLECAEPYRGDEARLLWAATITRRWQRTHWVASRTTAYLCLRLQAPKANHNPHVGRGQINVKITTDVSKTRIARITNTTRTHLITKTHSLRACFRFV